MLTRRLALKLLAPMVLVSLLLVAACIAGALYLNRLHADLSDVLSENIDSTVAARDLQTAVGDLLQALHGDHGDPEALTERLDNLNRLVRNRLQQPRDLANLDREKELTKRIADTLNKYNEDDRREAVQRRTSGPPQTPAWPRSWRTVR